MTCHALARCTLMGQVRKDQSQLNNSPDETLLELSPDGHILKLHYSDKSVLKGLGMLYLQTKHTFLAVYNYVQITPFYQMRQYYLNAPLVMYAED